MHHTQRKHEKKDDRIRQSILEKGLEHEVYCEYCSKQIDFKKTYVIIVLGKNNKKLNSNVSKKPNRDFNEKPNSNVNKRKENFF